MFFFGPIPMLWEIFSPPSFSRLPSSSSKPLFPVRARQKVGLLRMTARELACKLLGVCDCTVWYVG